MTEVTESTIKFPYKRSLGPVLGAFMTALTEQRIIGIRSGDTGARARRSSGIPRPAPSWRHDFVDVGPAGTVAVLDLGGHAHLAAPAGPARSRSR